ncbi:Homeobox protein prospero-like 2 [Homarus americanus]|uniref:Homeobox protein prospero-like 2 n=1 Tax=Homarus americanus TaxID=6706 RepID=A0A8J5N6J5_HOMAM|nr:Homeobox protein prospero-like 2 [Homarus americanus]
MSSHSSTLTPMHLRKAKLMFFFVRYPSSSVLKTYFPDIKFNKNNTAQLVKWFSNFRCFYVHAGVTMCSRASTVKLFEAQNTRTGASLE